MARREFEVRDIIEIYMHWQAGEGIRSIARNLGLDRNTVRKYIRPALEAGFKPGETRTEAEWAEFVRKTFPQIADPMKRHKVFEEIGQHRDAIKEGLKENKVSTVWQRLHDEAGLEGSLTSFRRYVRSMMPEATLAREVTVWRPEVPPGEEGQVDFGYLGKWTDPVTGMTHRVWAFVMVMAFSRHMFVKPVFRMDAKTWVESHILAFEFFGGVPRRVVLDNLKSGVLKPSIYDPAFNRDYAQMASHYGALVDPCRQGHPKDKPRVERQVPYVRESLWRGREFSSPSHMESEAVRWCLSVAGLRIHGTTRQRPLEQFENEEKPNLKALPEKRWESASWQTAKVGMDCHASVGGTLYSVPFKFAGRTLDVRVTDKTIQFFLGEELVKTHSRTKARRKTDVEDLPPEKMAFFARNPEWCLARAAEIGPAALAAVHEVLSVNTLYNLRQAQGLIRLAERYGALRVNAAAERAIGFGDPRYTTVKNILEKGLERLPSPELAEGTSDGLAGSLPAFLHGNAAFGQEE
ncbi:MAG: IS21 family transposase [Firmicutes bacterium]|jgi:transposase|nr:IS21 family transposase [Candidatus Fermentithermobacillaceae bacterium]